MEQEPDRSESWPITHEQATAAKETLQNAIREHHPGVRLGLGVYVVNKEYKVAIRLVEESQIELAAELANTYIPDVPVDIEVSGPLVAGVLEKAKSGQIMPHPGVLRPGGARNPHGAEFEADHEPRQVKNVLITVEGDIHAVAERLSRGGVQIDHIDSESSVITGVMYADTKDDILALRGVVAIDPNSDIQLWGE